MVEDNPPGSRRWTLAWLIRYWLPVVMMMGSMVYLSTDEFSAYKTQNFIDRWLWRLFPEMSGDQFLFFGTAIRKAMHFAEYFILGGLLFRAFRAGDLPRWRFSWSAYAFAVVTVWALIDEYHQTFTASRTGSIYDSLLDIAGGLVALLLIAWFYNGRRRQGLAL
jgi:VanZ family protein